MRVQLSWESGGETVSLDRCLRLSLLRDRYQPFSVLRAEFAAEADCPLPLGLTLTVGGQTVFCGLAREAALRRENGQTILSVHARSYSEALTRNQLQPGIHADVTLDSLMTAYALPHMTYEAVTGTVGYIYVREHTALWDAVIAYAYKRARAFPYLRVPNLLCVSPQTGTDAVILPENRLLRTADITDTGGMVSRVEMAELDGTPSRFVMDNPEAVRRNIVRVKQIPFDRQFASSPGDALAFRIALSNRRLLAREVTYAGYCGEDIGDLLRCGGLAARAGRILITADGSGITTAVRFYEDSFCGQPQESGIS
ncbi:MAG: hypothetical protein J6Z45_05330 [Oscillospiraceae bacterium]|nr:hypothetical protein [Oscillospiraceae bacterium]